MNIYQFNNININKDFIVLGLGPSAKQFTPEMKKSHIVIGVNDIERLGITPHYLVYLDFFKNMETGFDAKEGRAKWIKNFKAPYLFLFQYEPNKPYFNRTQLERCINMNYISVPFNSKKQDFSKDLIYYGADSPFVAVSLAIYMGAKSIKLLGVDYTDSPHAWGGYHPNNEHLRNKKRIIKDLQHIKRLSGVDITNIGEGSEIII